MLTLFKNVHLMVVACVYVFHSSISVAAPPADHSGALNMMSQRIIDYTGYNPAFSCELRNTYEIELSGVIYDYIDTDSPGYTYYEASRAMFYSNNPRRNSSVITLGSRSDVCWNGGVINAQVNRRPVRSSGITIRFHQLGVGSNVQINDLWLFGGLYGIVVKEKLQSLILTAINMNNVNKACISLVEFENLVIFDSMLNGCRVGMMTNRHYAFDNQLIMAKTIARIPNGGVLYFNDTNSAGSSMSIKLYDNILLFEGDHESVLDYVNDVVLRNVVDCGNNIFVFPEVRQASIVEHECGIITYDRSLWEEARTEWEIAHRNEETNLLGGRANLDQGLASDILEGRPSRIVMTELQRGGTGHLLPASRESITKAVTKGQRAAELLEGFVGRWSDATFWRDGTGWAE